jgi:hypothetical protein
MGMLLSLIAKKDCVPPARRRAKFGEDEHEWSAKKKRQSPEIKPADGSNPGSAINGGFGTSPS